MEAQRLLMLITRQDPARRPEAREALMALVEREREWRRERAQRAEQERRWARAFVEWSALLALGEEPKSCYRRDNLRERLKRESRLPLQIIGAPAALQARLPLEALQRGSERVRLQLEPPQCTLEHQQEQREITYIAGYRTRPNPEHQRLKSELRGELARSRLLERELNIAAAKLQTAQADQERFQRQRWRSAEERLKELKRREQEALSQHQAQRAQARRRQGFQASQREALRAHGLSLDKESQVPQGTRGITAAVKSLLKQEKRLKACEWGRRVLGRLKKIKRLIKEAERRRIQILKRAKERVALAERMEQADQESRRLNPCLPGCQSGWERQRTALAKATTRWRRSLKEERSARAAAARNLEAIASLWEQMPKQPKQKPKLFKSKIKKRPWAKGKKRRARSPRRPRERCPRDLARLLHSSSGKALREAARQMRRALQEPKAVARLLKAQVRLQEALRAAPRMRSSGAEISPEELSHQQRLRREAELVLERLRPRRRLLEQQRSDRAERLQGLQGRLSQLKQQTKQLQQALSREPMEFKEAIPASLEYLEDHWKRRCRQRLALGDEWLEEERSVEDRSHAAQPKAGLSDNPRILKSEAELSRGLKDLLLKRAEARLHALIAERQQQRWSQAQNLSGEEALKLRLGFLFHNPKRPLPDRALQEQLKAEHQSDLKVIKRSCR